MKPYTVRHLYPLSKLNEALYISLQYVNKFFTLEIDGVVLVTQSCTVQPRDFSKHGILIQIRKGFLAVYCLLVVYS
jgi:hypothetical protein